MSKTTGFTNVNNITKVGTSGHVLGKKLRSSIPQPVQLENLKKAVDCHCPINKNIPTNMSRRTFIATCKKFKEIAEKDRNRKNKFSVTTATGFRSSNKRTCLECKVGVLIKNNKPFPPPKGVNFIDLEDIKGRVLVSREIKRRGNRKLSRRKLKKKRIKLTEEDVIRIRKMFAEGYSVPGLCELFPITTSSMYRVVNKESWKNV